MAFANYNAVSRTNALSFPVVNVKAIDSTGNFRICYDEYTTTGAESDADDSTITFGGDIVPAGSRVCFAIIQTSGTAGIGKTANLAVGTADIIVGNQTLSAAALGYSDTHGETVDVAAFPVLTLAGSGTLAADVLIKIVIFYVID